MDTTVFEQFMKVKKEQMFEYMEEVATDDEKGEFITVAFKDPENGKGYDHIQARNWFYTKYFADLKPKAAEKKIPAKETFSSWFQYAKK